MGPRRALLACVLLAAAASCSTQDTAPSRALRYRMPESPPTLDPFQAGDDNSLVYVYLIFDGLVEYVPGTTDVRAAVAESWSVSPDGLTYTFKLRPGVRFHNGREVTAEDVVWSIRRALTKDARSLKRTFFNALAGVEEFWEGASADLPGVASPDPRTVVFRLSFPYAAFLTVLASEAGSIVPREVYSDPAQSYLKRPVGCGPFEFESEETGVSINLKRFASHWKSAPPDAIERIQLRVLQSPMTALEEYRRGGLEFTQEIPPGQRRRIQEEMPRDFRNWRKQQIFYLELNHSAGALSESRLLRQAILHAIDREFIVKTLQEDKDLVATGVIPPGMLGHDPAPAPSAYDPNLAADLLARSGHPRGEGLAPITYYTNATPGFLLLAERVQADLGRIGVRIEIKPMDFGAFLAAMKAAPGAEPFLHRQAFYADYPDPDNLLTEMLSPQGSANSGHYDNPAFTELLDRARRDTDRARRESLYREADRLAVDDVAVVPIYWFGQDALVSPRVGGFTGSPLGVFAIPWEEMSLTR